MNLISSPPASSSTSKFTLFPASPNPNPSKFFLLKTLIHSSPSRPLLPPPLFSLQSSPPPLLQEKPQPLNSSPDGGDENNKDEIGGSGQMIKASKESLEERGVARRPVLDASVEDGGGTDEKDDFEDRPSRSSPIDESLSKFAKKMPIFEPVRVESSSGEKPLKVNLELALYRAKVLTKNFRYGEAEKILQKCISYWPEDGRPYVALGKVLRKQSKTTEARAVYEKGCQATQGENSYIWQCWAVLEDKSGNIRRARELFDAATVADKRHIAAWHGWAILELKQGNIMRARNLLTKGINYGGGNEYVYQTLALLEVRAKRYEQARYLFKQATTCNPKSCASWIAWAQLEMQLENNCAARQLFEKAVKASPKNRFSWQVWGLFEANLGNIELGRKLLKVGHAVNPRDPVVLQSLALLEYKYSTADLARLLFKRASELDPKHQPIWSAWGWMEWREGNIDTARILYKRALSIDSTSETAARCLQAWGVLEQRVGNLSAARRLFKSSININSQSYVTWMTWASFEEDQGNSARAEEIRNLYFQQRTEVVDDASWVGGFLDIFDPAIDRIKRLLNWDKNSTNIPRPRADDKGEESVGTSDFIDGESESSFNLDAFIRAKLSLDPSKLDIQFETSQKPVEDVTKPRKRVWRSEDQTASEIQ